MKVFLIFAFLLTFNCFATESKIKSLNYCIDPNWMPYDKIDNDGDHIGMSSDYIELLSKKLNIKFNLIPTKSWVETLSKIKAKECDLIPTIMKTKDRSEYINFTEEYLYVPLVLASKNDASFVNSILDIKSEKISIPDEYAFFEILKEKYPHLNLIGVKDIDDGLDKVLNDDVYAYVGTLATVGYKLQTRYPGEIRTIAKLDETWNLSMGIRKDLVEVRDMINEAILIEKTRLAQIGEMIDSIAHQWNQPLNLISIKNSELKYKN